MKLTGTRGLILISRNPDCELQAAMSVDRVKELEFYRSYTGREYPGEYGERVSARRRGVKFETNLYMNRAALLRRALAPLYGLDAETMVVRNLADEVPGPPNELHAHRLHRTRRIFGDLAEDRQVPELLIQPQLALPVGPGPRDYEWVTPDALVLSLAQRMYVPVELKSFIVREQGADPGDLDHTRRQGGAQILALRAEAARVGLADRVTHNRVAFVFASTMGLNPAVPHEEDLDAAVFEIERAIRVFQSAKTRLEHLRVTNDPPLEMIADELQINYQEQCSRHCVLADSCKARAAGTVRVLGDAVSRLLGPDMREDRLRELLAGAGPRSAQEAAIAEGLRASASGDSYRPLNVRRMVS